jgi:RNA polymerase-interacting CarD/CdnL/TRCF family regulator
LSAGERKMLVTARRLLSEELSEVSGIDAGELMLSL